MLMSRYDVPGVMPPQRLPNWFPASIEAWNGKMDENGHGDLQSKYRG